MVNIATQLLFYMFIISAMNMMFVMFMNCNILIEWELMNLYSTKLNIPILLDPPSTLFMSTVLMIAASVMQFAKTYMQNDKFIDRFIILVLMFVMSMMFLIMLPHTMFLLLGWDGLGITSFVLVIYYNNPKSLGAGMITALTNRVGDVMLLVTIALMFNEGHWLMVNIWSSEIVSWVFLMIMVAAMTKSAQMPFSSWLPAAMAAPTPVSALVHSSTLVTAGVFLLYRFAPFLHNSSLYSPSLMMIATTTMLMASASAMAECDMKKIIALSTLSQVALMMFTLSLHLPEIAFFHLITHALFKALLFICAGNMIDIHHHSQDLRLMGNTSTQLPVVSTALIVANLALCGAPFLAGFYSKDLIIESFFMLHPHKNIVTYIMFIIATILTTAYSTRFILYTTACPTLSPPSQYSQENQIQITSMMGLSIMAVIGGAAANWLFLPPMEEPNFSSIYKSLAPLMMTLGIMMGLYNSYTPQSLSFNVTQFHCFMWFLTPLSSHLMPRLIMKLPLLELKETDQGWSLIPSLLFSHIHSPSNSLMTIQSSLLTTNIKCVSVFIIWLMIFMSV